VDDTKGTLGVYPRVVNVKSPGKNRIPVRIFNMTAKVVYLKTKSTICGLNEVKVMRQLNGSQYVCTNHYWNRFVIICFRYNQ
jgi:spore maturation protein SpmA